MSSPSPIGREGATIAARGPARPAVAPDVSARGPQPSTSTLDRVSEALPPPLRGAAVPPLLGWMGLFSITALVVLSALVRSSKEIDALEEAVAEDGPAASGAPSASPSASSSSRAAPKVAPPAELAAARQGGAEALAALVQRYPADGAAQRALFLAEVDSPAMWPAAVRDARRLLELEPSAAGDGEVQKALLLITNGPIAPANAALDLLATRMGTHGPDLLFELAEGSVKHSKDRAAALLQEAAVKKLATPALLVANELRAGTPCGRKAFVARAAAEGDDRSLQFLRPLLATTGCGFLGRQDCFKCLSAGDRTEIKGAIDAIEKRAGGRPRAPAPAPAPQPLPGKGGGLSPG
jgi:hypothetical protein